MTYRVEIKPLLWVCCGVLASLLAIGAGCKSSDGEGSVESGAAGAAAEIAKRYEGLSDEQMIAQLVLDSQQAGWMKHDPNAYLAPWAEESRLVTGRSQDDTHYDVVFDRKQLESNRRIVFSDEVSPSIKITHDDVSVTIEEDTAELRLKAVFSTEGSEETFGERYVLERVGDGWQITENRAWPLSKKVGDEATTYDAKAWAALDEAVIEATAGPDRRVEIDAMRNAYRYYDAYAVQNKFLLDETTQATASDWISFADLCMAAGHIDAAMKSYEKAKGLDESIHVPPQGINPEADPPPPKPKPAE